MYRQSYQQRAECGAQGDRHYLLYRVLVELRQDGHIVFNEVLLPAVPWGLLLGPGSTLGGGEAVPRVTVATPATLHQGFRFLTIAPSRK